MSKELVPISSSDGVLAYSTTPRANTLYNRIQEFLATQFSGCCGRTIKNNRTYLEIFEHYVGNQPLTPGLINGYAGWLDTVKRLSPGSIKDNMVRVKRFLRWAYRMEYAPKDLSIHMAKVLVPKLPTPLIFSHAEYELLKEKSEGSEIQWGIILSYHTGLDLVDVCFFKWDSVDLETMMIKCSRIKINRLGQQAVSEVPIITGSDLHTALLQKLKERVPPIEDDPDWVSPELARNYSWADTNIHQTFGRFIHKYCPKKTFKTFRRTFCSNLANSGINLAVACRMTAHSDPKTFLRYVRHDDEALRGGLEKALEYAQNKSAKPDPHAPAKNGGGNLPKDEPSKTKTNH